MNDIIKEILGHNSKIISFSKSFYREKYPDNIVVFNSNICTKNEKIWYGDIDITIDLNNLIKLAKNINDDIYILREYDARFENETKPLIQKYVVRITKEGKYFFQ